MRYVVTGGAGFIGSVATRRVLADAYRPVHSIDKLPYAAEPGINDEFSKSARYVFARIDVCDGPAVAARIAGYRPDGVIHLAAESHVDRSIDVPAAFVLTNIVGTATLLEAAERYWRSLDEGQRARFRFLHVSADKVFGSLGEDELPFDPPTPYSPRSPYAASKAGANHLATAWHHTYGLPVVVSNCPNKNGPHQLPEKLIPLTIVNAVHGNPLPVYGDGQNIRDWLHVDDPAKPPPRILEARTPGATYVVGGWAERRNLDVVRAICGILDELLPDSPNVPHASSITMVPDRPGHDRRYATDPARVESKLAWGPSVSSKEGQQTTVEWYLSHPGWWQRIEQRYAGQRPGLAKEPTS